MKVSLATLAVVALTLLSVSEAAKIKGKGGCGADGCVNIASKGRARQPDVNGHAFAEKALDGDTNGNYHSGSVTHTAGYGNDAWWSLTYPYPVYIEELQIFGRTDCCADRIDGASVTIDGKEVAILNHNDGRPMVVPVNKAGKVIMIRNKEGGSQLSLAEVLVMGAGTRGDPCRFGCDNIASQGLATQIDTDHNGQASRAIDGNTSNQWGSNSITHTKTGGPDAWWRLTFEKTMYIEQIKVYGREDCCADRLDKARVMVDGIFVGSLDHIKGFPNIISVYANGKEVEIRAPDGQPLSLAEVEVIGN